MTPQEKLKEIKEIMEKPGHVLMTTNSKWLIARVEQLQTEIAVHNKEWADERRCCPGVKALETMP